MRVWHVLGILTIVGGQDAFGALGDAYANGPPKDEIKSRRRLPSRPIITPEMGTLLKIEAAIKKLKSNTANPHNYVQMRRILKRMDLARKIVIAKGWSQAIVQELKDLGKMSLRLGLSGDKDVIDERASMFEAAMRANMDNVDNMLRAWENKLDEAMSNTTQKWKDKSAWWKVLDIAMAGNVSESANDARTLRRDMLNYKKQLSSHIHELNDLLEDARKDVDRLFGVWKGDEKKQAEIAESTVKGILKKVERIRMHIAKEGTAFQKLTDDHDAEIYNYVQYMDHRLQKDAEEWDGQVQKKITEIKDKYVDSGIDVGRDQMQKAEGDVDNDAIKEEEDIALKSQGIRRSLDEQWRDLVKGLDKVGRWDKKTRRFMLDKMGQLKGDEEKNFKNVAKVDAILLGLSTTRKQLLQNARASLSAQAMKLAETEMPVLSKTMYERLGDAGEAFNHTNTLFMANVSKMERDAAQTAQDLNDGREERLTQVDAMATNLKMGKEKMGQASQGTTALRKSLNQLMANLSKRVSEDHEEFMGNLNAKFKAVQNLTNDLTREKANVDTDLTKDMGEIDTQFKHTAEGVPNLVKTFTEQDEAQATVLDELNAQNARTVRMQLAMVQKANAQSGLLVNEILPAAKSYGMSRGNHLMQHISNMEAALQKGTSDLEAQAKEGASRGQQLQLRAAHTGQQLLSALHSTEAEQAEATQALDGKLDEVAEETGHRTGVLLTAATATEKRSREVEKAIRHAAAAPAKQLEQGREGMLNARKALGLRFGRAVEAARTTVDQKLSKTAREMYRGWDGQREALTSQVQYAAVHGERIPLATFRGVETQAGAREQEVAEGVAAGHAGVRDFERNLRGRAANATDWAERVAKNVSAAAAEGHRNAVLAAESVAAQQAAIDRKFQQVASAVATDAGVISREVAQARDHVVAQAKAMYERIARTEALSAEEKAVRLKEVDAWMEAAMSEVADQSTATEQELERAREAGGGVMAGAKAQATKLLERMEALDQQQGKTLGTDEGALPLEMLFEDLDGTVGRLGEEYERAWDRTADTHHKAAEAMRSEHNKANKGSQRILEGLGAQLERLLQRHEHQERRTRDDLQTEGTARAGLRDRAFTRMASSSEAVSAQASDRATRVRAIDEWTSGQQAVEASALERAARVLTLVQRTASDRLESRKAATARRVARIREAEEQPEAAALALAATANETVARTSKERGALEGWIDLYENQTAEWRGDVISSLEKLAAEMAKAEADVSRGGERVAAAVKYTEGAAASQIRTAEAHALEASNKRYASAAASAAATLDSLGSVIKADAARADATAARLAGESATGLRVASTSGVATAAATSETDASEFNKDVSRVQVVQANAFQSTNAILAAQQAELDDARDRLHSKLDEVQGALGGSLLELDSSDLADLTANAALNAEHSQLAAEVAALRHRGEAH